MPFSRDPADRLHPWMPGLAVAALAALYFGSLVPYGYHLGEDGDIVYMIYRTFSGQRPYEDFGSAYTPGFFYGNAALFHLFGVNILVLRWALVAVNAAAALGLCALARSVVPAPLAVVPALGYVALMPVFRGEFATFNVPYPAWYVVLTWLASMLALLRFASTRRIVWIAVAGVLAGVGCSIKPNTGAFNLAAVALALLFASAPEGGRLQRLAWWGLLVAVLVSIAAVFGFRLVNRDAVLMLWPVGALGIVRAAMPRRVAVRAIEAAAFLPAAAALVGGFALVTAPWLSYYLLRLGWERFVRDVLFIGSGHAMFFYMAIRELGRWDAALVVATAAALAGGLLVRRRRLRAEPVVAAAALLAVAGGAVVVWRAPMPEGFVFSVTQRLQHLAFGVGLLVHWSGVAYAGWRLWRGGSAGGDARSLAPVAIAIGAPVMFLNIYPRADFFHWVLSAPLTLVLGVMLCWRLVRLWLPQGPWAVAVAVPFYAVIAVFAWPGASTAALLYLSPAQSFVRLGLERAPVVLEKGRRQRLENLRRTVEYLRANSASTDTALGFPNLHLVNFLSGRDVPGRYGSFNPGWPDHVIEAEIVNDLERRRTPLVVANHDQQLYMGHAPLYYFMLRQYVRAHYDLAASFGSYDVLRRRDDDPAAGSDRAAPGRGAPAEEAPGTAGSGAAWASGDGASGGLPAAAASDCREAVAAGERLLPGDAGVLQVCWSGAETALQERAVNVVRASHDPGAIPALAEALGAGSLKPRAALLAVRAVGEIGDARALPAALRAHQVVDGRVRDELRTAIFIIAGRSLIESYVFHPRDSGELAVRHDPAAAAAAVAWVDDLDPRLRFAGAWLAGVCRQEAAIPSLRRMLGDLHVEVRAMAGDALVKLAVADGVAEPLLETMRRDEMFVPSVVLGWSRANPDRARELLAQTFRDGNPLQRETLAFLIGALGDRILGAVVQDGIDDPAPRVRIASVWTAGVLRLEQAQPRIAAAARSDPFEAVRRFAAESRKRL